MSLHIAAPEGPCSEIPALGLRLREAAREQLLLADEYLASAGEARHEGVHQTRKCIRRVRAALALGMRVFDRRAKRLDDDLGEICRGMSRLRDAQALIEALQRLGANAPDDARAILPDAEAAARRRRDRLLVQALAHDPEFLSRRRRLLAMRERLLRLDWQAIGDAEVAAAVRRSERRVEKAGQKAERHPDRDFDWHAFRRRLRRLHQQDTLLARLQPALRPTMKGSADRNGTLGEAQDNALLLRYCGRASPFERGQRTLLRRIARERLQLARRS